MNYKKTFLAVFFIIILSGFIFSIQNGYPIKNQLLNFKFNKIKFFIMPVGFEESYMDQYKLSGSYIFLRESIEGFFKNKTYSDIEPDLFIVFTFINSLYYLIKFKLNLWIYNKSIFSENNNKFKPYFNINYKNKLISIGFNIIL